MEPENVLKKLSEIGLAALVLLLGLSGIFWKERVFFADYTFSAFSILNKGPYVMANHRYGEIILQMVPYLEGKMHLPLKTILFSYAISVNVFYLLVMILLVYGFRQYRLAVLMALFYFLFTSVSFMTPTDVALGVAFTFMLFATTIFLQHRRVHFAIVLIPFFLLAFLTITTHLIVLIPTVFLFVYLVIEKKDWPFSTAKTVGLGVALGLAFLLKYITIVAEPAGYDSNHLYGVTHFSLIDIAKTFSSPVVLVFLYRCLVYYSVAIPVFLAGMAALLMRKEWKLAVWCLLSLAGYFILMGLTYGDLGTDILLWHIEGEWAAISILVATPVVFTVLPRMKVSVASLILIAIFLIRLAFIASAIPDFRWRVRFESDVLAQMRKKNITKLAIIRTPDLAQRLILDWALPFESTCMSALEGDNPERTFFLIAKDNTPLQQQIKQSKQYYNAWGMEPINSFNRRYFNFDTSRPYIVMSYEELNR